MFSALQVKYTGGWWSSGLAKRLPLLKQRSKVALLIACWWAAVEVRKLNFTPAFELSGRCESRTHHHAGNGGGAAAAAANESSAGGHGQTKGETKGGCQRNRNDFAQFEDCTYSSSSSIQRDAILTVGQ